MTPGRPGESAPYQYESGALETPERVENADERSSALTALRDVNLTLHKGEVLGLVGDNGAGKSKSSAAFHRPDTGRVYVDGAEVVLRSVDHARSIGIDTVYQDLVAEYRTGRAPRNSGRPAST
jgi:ABC-type sugar transport system ATPase subunit